MAEEQFQAWNHFVPRFYLKRFVCSPGVVWHYPLLVSHSSVHEWKRISIANDSAVARSHLYTVTADTAESDDVERWLAKEFDHHADEAIERAVSGNSLTKIHWRHLARFFGAQSLRTPASYVRHQQLWKKHAPLFDEALQNLSQDLAQVGEQNSILEPKAVSESVKAFPLRATITPSDTAGVSDVRVEIPFGRKSWLWSLKESLRNDGPLTFLEGHRWTILNAPEGHSWITSDNPAIQMGLARDGKRNLGGGWNAQNTVLMLPLSPQHMLYTEIGVRSPQKYTTVSITQFMDLNSVIAKNATRSLFASTQNQIVQELRPRQVNLSAFEYEKQQWQEWHQNHSEAERFINKAGSPPTPSTNR